MKNKRWLKFFFVILVLTSFIPCFAAQTSVKYKYDDLNRLIWEEYDNGKTTVYEYDEVGNRLSRRTVQQDIAMSILGDGSGSYVVYPSGTLTFTAGWSTGDYVWTIINQQPSTPGQTVAQIVGNATGNSVTIQALQPGTSQVRAVPVGAGTTMTGGAFTVIQPMIKIVGSGSIYSTLQDAYNAAVNGDILLGQNARITGNLIADRNILVIVEGGYNADFTARTGYTSLIGKLQTMPNGGVLTIKNFVLFSDTEPPIGTITTSYATDTNITLTLSCLDTVGCSQMRFSNDNATWSPAETYATTKAWTLPAGDGAKTVYAKFKDSAGNWSMVYSHTIILDTAAPLIDASPAGVYPAAQTVILACNDTGSGCDKIYYTTDGTTPTTASLVYTMPITVSTSLTMQFFAIDAAGNASAVQSQNYIITCGIVNAWGYGVDGQLGNGGTTSSTVPVPVLNLSCVTSVAGGDLHSLALKSDGTVWAWGHGAYGALGNGGTADSSVPVQVSNLTGVTAVAGGWYHSLALKNDGTVWAWGQGAYGALGNGGNVDSSVPIQVLDLTGVIAIAGGGVHSLAVKIDGTVWAWGFGWHGQLGYGGTNSSYVPVQVSNLTGVTAVTGGWIHSIALKSDGTVWAWGYNDYGQLGNAGMADSSVPTQVSNLTGVIAIARGGEHSLALMNDGVVWAWGRGELGQLGNGGTLDSSVPVRVSNLTGVVLLSGGGNHSLALKNDGTIWAWGSGGGTIDSSVPVQANGLSDHIAIGAGSFHSLSILGDDTNPPATAVSPGGGTYGATQYVTLTCSDASSGCDMTYYATDGTTPTILSTVYATPITVSQSTTINYFSRDVAGNTEAVQSSTYIIDTTMPTGSLVTNGGAPTVNTRDVTLTLSCNDTVSGCNQMQFSNDNVTWSTPEAFAATKTWQLTAGDGLKIVYVKFSDSANNWSSAFSTTVTLDTNVGPIRIVRSSTPVGYYDSLQAAYDAANNDDVIQVLAQPLVMNLNVNRNISVTLSGGYGADFMTITGMTMLKGMMQTFSGGGVLTINNITLQN